MSAQHTHQLGLYGHRGGSAKEAEKPAPRGSYLEQALQKSSKAP